MWRSVILVFVLALAACRSQPVEPLLINPPPEPIVEGTCDEVTTLERWLQIVVFQVPEFTDLLNRANNMERRGLREQVIILDDIRQYLVGFPAPDCAADTQAALYVAMTGTVEELTAYINQERDDIQTIVIDNQIRFRTVQDGLDALIERMEADLRGGP
jgi:hypothetical protein